MSWLVALVWVINFGISWLNAWGCGSSWDATKAKGGLAHFMNWMGAIMSASGFTWCYLVVLGCLGAVLPQAWLITPEEGQVVTGYMLEGEALKAFCDLGYLVIIFPILGSGLAITTHTWWEIAKGRRARTGDYLVAGWNTAAQVHNTYQALSAIPDAGAGVLDFFWGSGGTAGKSKDRGGAQLLVVALVLAALLAGVGTTYTILQSRRRAVAASAYREALAA